MRRRLLFVALGGGAAACRWGSRVPEPAARGVAYGPSPAQRYDVYLPAARFARPVPVAVLIHGGGWSDGARGEVARMVPYLSGAGYAVANIDYRLAAEAPAPAAAEDVRHAVANMGRRAGEWSLNSGRLMLVGFSAGGHLALLAALAPQGAVDGPPSPALAVVSFWGVTDVPDLLAGPNARAFAAYWLRDRLDRAALARALSPLSYAGSAAAAAPAICAIHSVHDDIVPFRHSQAMVERWTEAGRAAKLIELSHPGHEAREGDYPALFAQALAFVKRATGGRLPGS